MGDKGEINKSSLFNISSASTKQSDLLGEPNDDDKKHLTSTKKPVLS